MVPELLPSPAAVAARAARLIAATAADAIAARGRFTLAVSGGRTPWAMLALLADEPLDWSAVHLFQTDERVAPAGDPDRNWTQITEHLVSRVPLPPANRHPMPVEDDDLDAAAARYARVLEAVAGQPPVLDLVHLGLGDDGHTASLVPGDPVLEVEDADVAPTGLYRGRRRLTLTYPALARARRLLWVVTGPDKAAMLARLVRGDRSIPAGRVPPARAVVLGTFS